MPLVAALHPVNAMVLTWVAVALARRAAVYWTPIERSARTPVAEGTPAAA
jgi:hypothetical protein